MGAFAFSGTKYANATGDSLMPGMLIVAEGGDGTLYVLNYKLEKHPVNLAGFNRYYASPGMRPFMNVISVPKAKVDALPTASMITGDSGPATVTAPATVLQEAGAQEEAALLTISGSKRLGNIVIWAVVGIIVYYALKKS